MPHSKLRLVKSTSPDSGDPSEPDSPTPQTRAEQLRYVELLFDKYRGTLRGYLARLLNNDDDASELLQETYTRLLQQEHLDHLEVNARAYLFKVATNLVRDKARRDKARHRGEHQPLEDSELVSAQPTPQAQVEWSRALEQLKAALQELPPRYRQVFIMNRFQHMSYPEIADLLGITTRTVERNMSVALAFCKQKLEGVL